jgi:hypothetical protein
MKKPTLVWLGLTLAWYATAILGTIYNEYHFLNIFMFVTWVLAIGWVFVYTGLCAAKILDKDGYMPRERSVSAIVAFLADFGIALLMTAYGHWFYATLVMFQQVIEQLYFHKPEQKGNTNNVG